MRTWDVVVVGGGPAGSAAARAAAQAGGAVLLLEAEQFPRFKPCAGGVTAAALAELAATGQPAPPEVLGRLCRSIRPRYAELSVTVNRDEPVVAVVRRAAFDDYLLSRARAAGAEVRHGVRVEEVRQGREGVTLRTSRGPVEARVVIGADGAQSRVARAVRPAFRRADLGVCQVAELNLRPEAHEAFFEHGLEVRYGDVPGGYTWIFPTATGLNVGLGSLSPGLTSLRHHFSSFLAAAGLPEPERVRGAVLPLGGRRHTVRAGRILLAGDAAGVADPFTGEGIRYALISGRLAGECAMEALQRAPDAPDLSAYAGRCEAAFGTDLRYAFLLGRLFLKLPGLLNRPVFRHPGLFSRVADILQGRETYQGMAGKLGQSLPGYWLRGLTQRAGVTRGT
ncbi:MAG: NAD(P)/FAD-dependent oxidoreductase [Chitinophagales bacterium]